MQYGSQVQVECTESLSDLPSVSHGRSTCSIALVSYHTEEEVDTGRIYHRNGTTSRWEPTSPRMVVTRSQGKHRGPNSIQHRELSSQHARS